jgi:hypothetical protein
VYHAAQDLIEYLMATVGGGAQDSEHRVLRSAAHQAYRDLLNVRDWNWLAGEMALPAAIAGSDGKKFLLPVGVRSVDALVPPERTTPVIYVLPREARMLESVTASTNGPVYWTAVRSSTKPDRWEIHMAGNPTPIDPAESYYIWYRRTAQPLKYMGYEPVCRDGSLTAVEAPGAVKRYGTAAHHPEGPAGLYPYTAEEILGLANSLVGTPPPDAKTVVSDRLDVSDAMYSSLLAGAEAWVAKLLGKNVEGALAVYNRELRLAFEADVVAPISGRRVAVGRYPESDSLWWGTPRSLGYYSPSAPDTGA